THNTCDGAKPWNQGAGIAGGKYADVGPAPAPDIGVELRDTHVPLDPAKAVKGQWIELDVTNLVHLRHIAGHKAERMTPGKEINLLLRSSTLGRNYTFRSREAKEAAERPQLVVRTADGIPTFSLK